jgi:pyrroline-5-carboxylate reductase
MGGALLLAFKNNFQKFDVDIDKIFYLCDPDLEKKNIYSKQGFNNFGDQEAIVFKNCKIIFICVKPDTVEGLLDRNRFLINKNTMLVSICAGISINYIEKILSHNIPKVIRIMANHLCLMFESASVYSTNNLCLAEDEEIVKLLLRNVGLIKKVNEKQMNAFTALSGSGPAFVYQFAESLIDGALKNGVDISTAREYAIQVIYGAAKYMKESNEKNPNTIKYIVTTPNGTTIVGLTELDKYKFKFAVNQAITAATKRGAEIEDEKIKSFTKPKF